MRKPVSSCGRLPCREAAEDPERRLSCRKGILTRQDTESSSGCENGTKDHRLIRLAALGVFSEGLDGQQNDAKPGGICNESLVAQLGGVVDSKEATYTFAEILDSKLFGGDT